MRVLVAGFKHETNSFASNRADWAAFERGEMMPKPVHGAAMLDMIANVDVSASGFARQAAQRGWTLLPGFWCGAVPSAHVTDEAFEKISASILADVEKRDYDAIYLELHGAAMTETYDDAEGELLSRVRERVGPGVPIVASLDLHANVTRGMLEHADGLVAFRTYPHIDYVLTGERAAELLERLVRNGGREASHAERLPFLISVSMQSTTMQPARGAYELLEELDRRHDTVSSFCMGFPAADFEECSPVVWSHGARAKETIDALVAAVGEPSQWRLHALSARDAVDAAIGRARASARAVVVADMQDNPGAGGTATSTGMLHALLAAGAGGTFPKRVALGVLYDPRAAKHAHEIGIGGVFEGDLGEQLQTPVGPSEPPVHGRFRVLALSNGETVFKGPKMTGFKPQLGPTACLEIEGVLIVVASGRIGTQDRELFRMVGIDPEAMKVIVVKSSHHFRADFERLVENPATDIVIAHATGMFPADPGELPWKRLAASTRTRP